MIAKFNGSQIGKEVKSQKCPLEVILRGNPYQRGFKHGQQFAKDIQLSIDSFKHESENRSVLSVIDKTIAFLDEKFTEINEEIRGISDGAKVPFKDAFLFNDRAIVKAVNLENCSGVAISNNGTVMVGMNKDRDCPVPAYDKYFLKKVYPERGYSYISYGHVGRIWGHGMNEAGLCTAGTAARPLHNEVKVPSFGSYFLPPVLLSRCKNVSEALDLIDEIDTICDSGNFLLCDASGQMVVVEMTPQKRVVRKPQNGQLIVSTFYASGQIEHNNDIAYLEDSKQRFNVIENVLSQEDNLEFDTIKKILRSHSGRGSVCRHNESGFCTVLSWIAFPKQLKFFFCNGIPCENEYKLDFFLTGNHGVTRG